MQIPKLLTHRVLGCAIAGLGLCLLTGSEARAGTFTATFDNGQLPAGMNVYGAIATVPYDLSTGGNPGGCLKLTQLTGSEQSGMYIDDFDSGQTIAGFDVKFDVYIGSGSGADGMSFFFGDFADNVSAAEEGPGTIHGLTVCFDSYNNGGTPGEAPAIDLKWNNGRG